MAASRGMPAGTTAAMRSPSRARSDEKKSFEDATPYCYDNGVYKITSRGRSTTGCTWSTAR
ncbi:hypothetical protein SAMN04489708_12934 [Paracidovorax cattleyae]|uniref:Uncharacterized protein n=1 Tax=Paracidovorax cattleyae TaxID=80868 RepID=A0A1H0VW70_9BURK|nr:hypothetical protein SAMN04489708_12934 [Paracidovorax cattleyae]